MKRVEYRCGKCKGNVPSLPGKWTGHLVLYCPCGHSFVNFGRYKDYKKAGVIGFGGLVEILTLSTAETGRFLSD